jgi:hypothetical protein
VELRAVREEDADLDGAGICQMLATVEDKQSAQRLEVAG